MKPYLRLLRLPFHSAASPASRPQLLALGRRAAFALTSVLTLGLTLALSACGGGGGGTDLAAGSVTVPSLSGTVSDGVVIDINNFQGLDVTVKGSVGTARETSAIAVTTSYSVTLDQLAAPYLLSANVLDGIRLLAPATANGTANLTPLTTLLVAWMFGTDPAAYFDNTLAGQGGVPTFSDADRAAAQREVTRYLARVTQVQLSAGVASSNWVTAPMRNAPGDSMFDQIAVLNNALAAAGSSLAQLANEVAAQVQRCERSSVAVTGSVDASRFCQQDSSARFTNDNRLHLFDFADVEGSKLSLTVNSGVVDRVTYLTREGFFLCDGAAACAGVTVGALAADDSVPIVLSALKLKTTAGAEISLTGTLAGAGALPTVPCEVDKFYLLDPAGGVRGLCLYEAGTSTRGSLQDYSWGSLDADQPYQLELVSDGSSVSSIDVWWFDPDTGNPVTLYRCEGSGCSGVAISEPYDGTDSNGDPFRARNFTLQKLPLVAVDSEGRLGGTVVMNLTASLVNKVPGPTFTPDCSNSVEHNRVVFSDTTPAIDICPPPPSSDDYYSFKGASPYYLPDEPDAVDFSVSTYVLPVDGSLSALNTLHVVLSGDRVLKVFLQTLGDSRVFSCTGSACAGVTVSAFDDEGQRSLGLDGTLLSEDPVRQVPGSGATARVTGGFLSLADPYFVPP